MLSMAVHATRGRAAEAALPGPKLVATTSAKADKILRFRLPARGLIPANRPKSRPKQARTGAAPAWAGPHPARIGSNWLELADFGGGERRRGEMISTSSQSLTSCSDMRRAAAVARAREGGRNGRCPCPRSGHFWPRPPAVRRTNLSATRFAGRNTRPPEYPPPWLPAPPVGTRSAHSIGMHRE